MKKILLLVPALAGCMFGQAAFPSHTATTADLLTASDQAQTTLSSSMSSSDLIINVVAGQAFLANSVINIDNEQVKICGASATSLTVCSAGRGFAGTSASAHQVGAQASNFIDAIYHNLMATEVISIEGWLATHGGSFFGFGSTLAASPDAGITRPSANTFSFGNGTPGDSTATVNAGTLNSTAVNSGTITATGTGGFVGDGSCITRQGVIYAACYGVSATNPDNAPAITAAMQAAYNTGAPGGVRSPSIVQLPSGTLVVGSQLQVPHTVHLNGTGRGDNASLIPTLGNHTVIQASPGWTPASAAYHDQALIVVGGSGALSAEYFGEGVSNLTIDGYNSSPGSSAAPGGIWFGNSQEQSNSHHLLIVNTSKYGVAIWGANNNSNTGTINTPWGEPAQYQGAANDGDYSDIEIYPYHAANSGTIPLLAMNIASTRAIKNITIATETPSQDGGVYTPNVCGMLWGSNGNFQSLHCEGPKDGFIVGPTGGAAFQYGDGAKAFTFLNMHYSTPGYGSGCVLHLQNIKGVTAIGTFGGQTAAICDDNNGYNGNDTFYTADYDPNDNSRQEIGTRFGINFKAPILTTGDITGQNIVGQGEFNAPCMVMQYRETTPWLSPFHRWCENSNGDLVITSLGVIAPATTKPASNIFVQGSQTLGFGIGANRSGLNLSAPMDFTNSVQSIIGNNLSYEAHTYDTGVPKIHIDNSGQPAANGFVFDYSGASFVGETGSGVGDYSIATALGWQSARFNNNGTQTFGNSGVSGAVSTFVNSAASCVINPSVSGFVCSSDETLKKDITPMDKALASLLKLRPVTFRWSGEQEKDAAHPGFIAQEVAKVMPDMVSKGPNGKLQLQQQALIPYLVQAIQDQQKQIEDLKKQVAAKKRHFLFF